MYHDLDHADPTVTTQPDTDVKPELWASKYKPVPAYRCATANANHRDKTREGRQNQDKLSQPAPARTLHEVIYTPWQ